MLPTQQSLLSLADKLVGRHLACLLRSPVSNDVGQYEYLVQSRNPYLRHAEVGSTCFQAIANSSLVILKPIMKSHLTKLLYSKQSAVTDLRSETISYGSRGVSFVLDMSSSASYHALADSRRRRS